MKKYIDDLVRRTVNRRRHKPSVYSYDLDLQSVRTHLGERLCVLEHAL